MHPLDDQVVLYLSEQVTLHQRHDNVSKSSVTIYAGAYAINPPGGWHNIGPFHFFDMGSHALLAKAAEWRRRRDSNPRYRIYQYDGLANRGFQPLTHVSSALGIGGL